MTADILLWNLLLAATPVLLALPFCPVWSEWRHARSRSAWQASANTADGHLPQNTTTGQWLHLAPGACFGQLQSERIVLGVGPVPLPARLPVLERWQPPIGARPWGIRGWHIAHALVIPQDHLVPCALVVRGPLNMQGPGRIEGDVKVRNSIRLGPACHVRGNLLSEGDIRIGPGCHIRGDVMAEGKLHLSPGVVIGSPQQPVSVCADVIEAEGPVLIHGSVHARIQGVIAPTRPQHRHTT